MCYPYFQSFCWFIGNYEQAKKISNYNSPFPVLFLYGGKKRVMYHGESYLTYLDSRPDCRCKCFENDGHWLHWTSPDEVTNEIKKFLL